MSTTDRGELSKVSVIKEYLTTAGDWQPSATVKESLTVQNEASQADAEEFAELARIEKQLEQKKDKR
jgi:hypothetical protein